MQLMKWEPLSIMTPREVPNLVNIFFIKNLLTVITSFLAQEIASTHFLHKMQIQPLDCVKWSHKINSPNTWSFVAMGDVSNPLTPVTIDNKNFYILKKTGQKYPLCKTLAAIFCSPKCPLYVALLRNTSLQDVTGL